MAPRSNAVPNNKRLKRQDQTKEGQEQTMAADTLMLPHLSDLIVEKIFRLIPTKLAVRSILVSKQWANVWSLGVPFLNFDDEGDSRKLLFMDFVESCLKHFEKTKLLGLDRFTLRMTYDSELIDSTRIDKWFSFVADRCVKELYVSIQSSVQTASTYYCIPHTILNAQYLTHLSLQHVRIPGNGDLISLPLLKDMKLNSVRLDSDNPLWKGCPSIKHLWLISCSFSSLGDSRRIAVNNSTLRYLQVLYCECEFIVVEAENLEFFILTSLVPQLRQIILRDGCVKLKIISIYAHLAEQNYFRMPGKSQHCLAAFITIPNLAHLKYSGYLMPRDILALKTRKPFDASLTLNWDADDQGLQPPRTRFLTWGKFLLNFSCCNEIELDIHHDAVAGALTFPENFRKFFSPPLLHVRSLKVFLVRGRCPQTMAGISAFVDSLRWMAPKAQISLASWDYGESDSSEEDE